MDDVARAAQTIADFLQTFTTCSGLRLRYRVKLRGAKRDEAGTETAGGSGPQTLYVEFTGPDSHMLTAHNGELLNSLEHVAAKILRLEPDSHDQVSFDADHFKADRDRRLQESAAAAVERVRTTGRPHAFPAMSSRERRMLHLILASSGLPTASSGEGPGRYVVLYPEGGEIEDHEAAAQPTRPRDASHIRSAFRHR